MDVGSLASLASSIKAAADITRIIIDGKLDNEVKIKTLELQQLLFKMSSEMLALQSEHSSILSEHTKLKDKIMKLESWSQEKANYRLHEMAPGSLVYTAKDSNDNQEPAHYLCANCYNNNIKSILQFSGYEDNFHKYTCHQCNNITLGKREPMEVIFASSPSKWDDY